MPEFGKEAIFNKYKNIFGDTKATIEAIQKYLNENSTSKTEIEEALYEEEPAASINKILQAYFYKSCSYEFRKNSSFSRLA